MFIHPYQGHEIRLAYLASSIWQTEVYGTSASILLTRARRASREGPVAFLVIFSALHFPGERRIIWGVAE